MSSIQSGLVSRYFKQRPKVGCFHAVEFGVRYTPRGPIYGAVVGEQYDIPESHTQVRIENCKLRKRMEMQVYEDGSILYVFGNQDGQPVEVCSSKVQWPEPEKNNEDKSKPT